MHCNAFALTDLFSLLWDPLMGLHQRVLYTAGGSLSSANRANTIAGWLSDHLTKFNNWVDDMNDYVLTLRTETAFKQRRTY